ncbi:hypothetical protein [Jannaschia seohaensis]|uniref:Uncharacterized protein n=1 Tax=Jannaschia seohaensis TaxID=475081 RepID=A0A2Y9B5B8_9RHOB|nr:hypothetical protein [Jannaschia seohaensis]PWJ10354.1 hypothetical protein BCF38_12433 [Jannaschia seohaensis]SSA51754.1 hypothetical protein SAMN05421539_12433 [Jannaschia seohaensis]
MEFASLEDLTARADTLGTGPVLALLCEDGVELASSLEHHLALGFAAIVLALAPGVPLPAPLPDRVHPLRLDRRPDDLAPVVVNALLAGRPAGAWTGWCYNAEFLHTPFCETRPVGAALAFCAEERRDHLIAVLADLYPADLTAHPGGVDRESAMLDARGYYALGRWDPALRAEKPRQVDIHGGLRWRFEEHVPWTRRRIDRVALMRARPGLRLLPDHRVSVEEMNTIQCEWHHSMTACITSFRAAKALATNPGSRAAIRGFRWDGSVPFTGGAQQLMELGLMEPGQWF